MFGGAGGGGGGLVGGEGGKGGGEGGGTGGEDGGVGLEALQEVNLAESLATDKGRTTTRKSRE